MRSTILIMTLVSLDSASYYALRRFSVESPSDEDLLWLMILLVTFILSVWFRAGIKTVVMVLVLNPISTIFIDTAFGDHFPHFHCEYNSIEFNLFRLTIKTVIETLPVLLGFAIWTWKEKLKLKNSC